MAAPTVKKTKKPKPPRRPVEKIAENLVDAEATGAHVTMEWRGHTFLIDLQQIRFGRAAFAFRQVDNESLPLMSRVTALVDMVEAAFGPEQTAAIVELAPNLFDDHDTYASFWQTFTQAVTGAMPGESSAS